MLFQCVGRPKKQYERGCNMCLIRDSLLQEFILARRCLRILKALNGPTTRINHPFPPTIPSLRREGNRLRLCIKNKSAMKNIRRPSIVLQIGTEDARYLKTYSYLNTQVNGGSPGRCFCARYPQGHKNVPRNFHEESM